MLMVGSRALEMQLKRQDKELYRPCVDLDYLCTEREWQIQSVIHAHDELVELVERTGNKGHVKMVAGAHIEYDIAQPGDSTDLLIQYCKASPQSLFLNNEYYRDWETDRKSTRLNSSHSAKSRMPSSA